MESERDHVEREERRELRRDEVAAPDVGGFIGEIERDAGYMRYRALRLLGPAGRFVGVVAILAIIVAVLLRALR